MIDSIARFPPKLQNSVIYDITTDCHIQFGLLWPPVQLKPTTERRRLHNVSVFSIQSVGHMAFSVISEPCLWVVTPQIIAETFTNILLNKTKILQMVENVQI